MARTAVILAAGQGVRMKSDLPKVLHKIGDRPMVSYVIESVRSIQPERIYVVVGYGARMVIEACGDEGVDFVYQEEQLGTGHAVIQCEEPLKGFEGTVIVLNGDVPCVRPSTIKEFTGFHEGEAAAGTVLSGILADPSGYGRIIRNSDGSLDGIVEEKDATDEERKIKEINSGLFCFEKSLLFESLREIDRSNVQNEYYLTDVIRIMKGKGWSVRVFCAEDAWEVSGVNTIEELDRVRKFFEGGVK